MPKSPACGKRRAVGSQIARTARRIERLMMGECRGSGDYVPLWRAEVRVGA